MLDSNLKTKWFAYTRADFIIRDEKAGILKKMVDAGFFYTLIGVERANSKHLASLSKSKYYADKCEQAFRILKRYPEVFTNGTFVFGTEDETKETCQPLPRKSQGQTCPSDIQSEQAYDSYC